MGNTFFSNLKYLILLWNVILSIHSAAWTWTPFKLIRLRRTARDALPRCPPSGQTLLERLVSECVKEREWQKQFASFCSAPLSLCTRQALTFLSVDIKTQIGEKHRRSQKSKPYHLSAHKTPTGKSAPQTGLSLFQLTHFYYSYFLVDYYCLNASCLWKYCGSKTSNRTTKNNSFLTLLMF